MKKQLAVLLAAMMLVGTMPLAAGAETAAPSPEIDMNMDAAELLEDLGIVMPGEDTDWEAEQAEQLRQEKVDLGMPYPDGMNVTLNGKYLDFGGVAPVGVDSYMVQVPFRAFLEGLGGKVAYEGGQFIATMPDGASIVAQPDSTTLTHTVGEEINTVELYAPPVVMDRVTYVEGWALAEVLGLGVDVDSHYGILHLTDWAAVAAEIDGRFTALNALLATAQTTRDPEKAYLGRVNMTAVGTLYGDKKDDTATLTATGETLIRGAQMEVSAGLKLDLGDIKDTLFPALDEEQQTLLKFLSDLKVSARGDLEQGSLYFKCNKLAELPGSPITGDPWLSMTANEGMMGLLEEARTERLGTAEARTVGKLLVGYCQNSGYYGYGGRTPYDEALSQAKELDVLLGDENFTVTTAGSTTTYAVNMDQARLEKRVAERLEEDKADGAWATLVDIPFVKSAMPDIAYTLTVKVREGKIVDCRLDGGVKWVDTIPLELTFHLTGNQTAATGSMTLKGAYLGKIELNMDVKTGETTRKPLTAPGKDEVVLDMSALQGQ